MRFVALMLICSACATVKTKDAAPLDEAMVTETAPAPERKVASVPCAEQCTLLLERCKDFAASRRAQTMAVEANAQFASQVYENDLGICLSDAADCRSSCTATN